MKIVPLFLLVAIALICAKVYSLDVYAAMKGGKDIMGKGSLGHRTITGDLTKNKIDTENKIKYNEKLAPREFMNDFSISIDNFNTRIHSDVLMLITNFILGLVQFV